MNAISQVACFKSCISLNKRLWAEICFSDLGRNSCRNGLKIFLGVKQCSRLEGNFFKVHISKTFFSRQLWKSTFFGFPNSPKLTFWEPKIHIPFSKKWIILRFPCISSVLTVVRSWNKVRMIPLTLVRCFFRSRTSDQPSNFFWGSKVS